MSSGRPPFSFLLFDLPSDHEIDGGVITECQVISAILHNRRMGSKTKTIRATSLDTLAVSRLRPYRKLGFVHVATHGSRTGVSLLGGRIPWAELAIRLKAVAPRLAPDQRRILCLSCCYSKYGYMALKKTLRGHFSGLYHFKEREIGFATAMTVWSMFYRKKTIKRPALGVVDPINRFFDREVLVYQSI